MTANTLPVHDVETGPRVVVIDDELDHLAGLANGLNRHGIPCRQVHCDGDPDRHWSVAECTAHSRRPSPWQWCTHDGSDNGFQRHRHAAGGRQSDRPVLT